MPNLQRADSRISSHVEFDRASNIISFQLGAQQFQCTSTQLAELLHLPIDNAHLMNDTNVPAAHVDPSNQAIMDYMVDMNANWTQTF